MSEKLAKVIYLDEFRKRKHPSWLPKVMTPEHIQELLDEEDEYEGEEDTD